MLFCGYKMRKKTLAYIAFFISALAVWAMLFTILKVNVERKSIGKPAAASLQKDIVNYRLVTEDVLKELKTTGQYTSCSSRTDVKLTTNYHETDYPYFKDSFKINVSPVDTWISEASVKTFCDKNVRTFDNRFAILHDVILNNSKRINADKNHKGGEHLKDVLGQNEADEIFKCSKGFWSIRCDSNDIQRNRNLP